MIFRQFPFEIVQTVHEHQTTLRIYAGRGPDRVLDACRWCRFEVGETGWGYRERTFYFRDPAQAVAFKMRWG